MAVDRARVAAPGRAARPIPDAMHGLTADDDLVVLLTVAPQA